MKRIAVILILLLTVSFLSFSGSHAFELNGFADVSFTKSTEGADEFRNGDFAFGTLDLYLAENLENVEILSELVVEFGNVVDLERLYLGYTFSDELRIRIGRYHTPLGVWNTSYHHGVQLQPTINRPVFLNFEDDAGILPTHVVGAYLSGRTRTTAGVLEYGAMIGNGPRITSEDGGTPVLNANNTSDDNIGKAIAFHAAISPAMVDGLKVGLSTHITEVKSDDAADARAALSDEVGTDIVNSTVSVDQIIYGAAITYSTGNVDIAGEYFAINDNDELLDKDYNSNAYYGLITYTFKEKWVPYLLYEKMSVKGDDPYFDFLNTKDITKTTLGLRYNITYRSSVKGEVRSVEKGGSDWNEFAVQWALAF
ncbi:MAG: hypothetical protein HZA12_07305 [Nitrospirae bacterium]|nr:hypothetical protein [Nitrospirota bacterium]